MQETDPATGKPVVSSAGKFMGWNTIYGRDGEHGTPYMTRVWFWGLRLHIFHRPDLDEDCHDHPWDFWTLPIWPIHGYVEEVVEPTAKGPWPQTCDLCEDLDGCRSCTLSGEMNPHRKFLQVVPAFRISFRPATHCHRVLGAWTGEGAHPHWGDRHKMHVSVLKDWAWNPVVNPNRKLVTLVWRTHSKRPWGFLKNRDGQWCWVAWRDYVFAGGKDGPCQ